MTIKTGDTVKLIAPFGLNAQGEAEYPDVYDVGKYGSVTHKEGEYFNVKLFSSGAEYAALENELQKITFYIVDHEGKKVADLASYEEANGKLDETESELTESAEEINVGFELWTKETIPKTRTNIANE